MEKLVSILTPCYNGAKYIERYSKALLEQDYNNCQLIFMDDGSTDNSKEKILSYKKQFEDKGFQFEYHYHENVGLGATIAKGIQFVKGDYLIWPDVDDMLTPDSISKKVRFLESRTELGLVRTRYRKLLEDADNDMSIIGPSCVVDPSKEELFEDYLLSKGGVWLQPGCFMVRMSAFDAANPDRYIYPTRRGQDWQMLLPLMYKYKCGFIDEPLYIYAIHSGSMSDASKDTLDTVIKRYEMYEELIVATVNHMNIPEEEEYTKMVHCHYLKQKIDVAFTYNEYELAKISYDELKEFEQVDRTHYIKVLLLKYPLLNRLFKMIRK